MVKNVMTDNRIDVINIATNGRNAFERNSFRFTFNPNPTITIVNCKVVKWAIPFKIVVGKINWNGSLTSVADSIRLSR